MGGAGATGDMQMRGAGPYINPRAASGWLALLEETGSGTDLTWFSSAAEAGPGWPLCFPGRGPCRRGS